MIRQPIRNNTSQKAVKPRIFDALIDGEEVYIEVKQAKDRELIRLCDVLAGHRNTIQTLIRKYGGKKFSDIDPKHYPALQKDAEGLQDAT